LRRRSPLSLVANRGIGLGVVKELLRLGWSVIATARRPDAATELKTSRRRESGESWKIQALEMNNPGQLDRFRRRDGRQVVGRRC